MAPEDKNRSKQIIIGGGNKDTKAIRDLTTKINNFEKLIDSAKLDQVRPNIENLKEMVFDL